MNADEEGRFLGFWWVRSLFYLNRSRRRERRGKKSNFWFVDGCDRLFIFTADASFGTRMNADEEKAALVITLLFTALLMAYLLANKLMAQVLLIRQIF